MAVVVTFGEFGEIQESWKLATDGLSKNMVVVVANFGKRKGAWEALKKAIDAHRKNIPTLHSNHIISYPN